ncbi:hypothetical protein [Natronomonas sp.]|uniref:DUF7261 family protein n=1 Tax=Natronomonas sp. TaxID=2184060 RepID=UPI00398A310B
MNPSAETRGQIVLVAALFVATMLVSLALVLNAGIFAENISSRGTASVDGATAYAADADRTITEAATRTGTSDAATAANSQSVFVAIVDDWARSRSRTAAEVGAVAELEWTSHIGWRLQQTTNRRYMPEGETATSDWTVTEGVPNVSTMQFEAETSSLYDAGTAFEDTADEAFRLNVSDGTTTWELYLFREAADGRFIAHVGDPSSATDLSTLLGESSTCDVVAGQPTVDLRAATLDGDDCPALEFADDLDGPVTIRYENVYNSTAGENRIVGGYDILVNGSTAVATNATGHPEDFSVPGGSDPTAQALVYSVNYRTHYEREEVLSVRDGRYEPFEEAYP